MDIEELRSKHYDIHFGEDYKINPPIYHTNLSIEFAISVLKDLHEKNKYKEGSQALYYKIQELKTYLDDTKQ